MTLNGKQIFLIVGAIISVLMVAGTQLTDLFGPIVTKSITAVAALLNSVLGATLAVIRPFELDYQLSDGRSHGHHAAGRSGPAGAGNAWR